MGNTSVDLVLNIGGVKFRGCCSSCSYTWCIMCRLRNTRTMLQNLSQIQNGGDQLSI